jgi:exonuclease SbcC
LGEADLEPVIQTLQNLHGGNRLVGIISHVYELRQRIKTQLVVTKGRTGSSARFVLE